MASTINIKDPELVRRRRSTANRVLSTLKAALNYAFHEGRIRSDEAWRRVKPFRGVNQAKIRYLSLQEASRLVEHCADDFRPFVHAALLTGCRYGELVNLACSDFDMIAGTIYIRFSKSGKARYVVLSQDGIDLFKCLVHDRLLSDIIFKRSDGKTWGKNFQQRPLAYACEKAKIIPAISFHILRHTYASQLVSVGVPLVVIAANLGHSDTRITERHYAHLTQSYVAITIRAAMDTLKKTRK